MKAFARSLLKGLARSRVAVGAMAGLLVIFAAIATHQMPLQLLPEVHYPQIRVIGDLPGQTSSVIEETINEPLEATLAAVPGLVRMESRSGDGRSYIDLFFEPDHDIARGLREVTLGVQQARAQMPAQFPEPRIFEVATTKEPAMQYAFGSGDLTTQELRQLLRSTLLPRLRGIEGVDRVFIGREEDPELVVEIDPLRQRVLNVGLGQIEKTLLRATAPPLTDRLMNERFDGVGVLDQALWDPSRLMERPVDAHAGLHPNLPLSDLGHAYRAPSETSLRTRLNGEPAVLVTIHRTPRAQSLRTAAAVRDTVDSVMARGAFDKVRVTLLFDDSVVTRGAVRSVLVAVAAGSLLAMSLVFFVLRQGRRVLMVGAVVVVSLSAAMLGLAAAGMSLNLLTLAGLLISVGLSLDYAIIYFDRLEKSALSEKEASIETMLEVASPLLGALLTTVAAIAPFLLVQGLVAKLFHPLILTVILSSVFAYCAAFLLLPVFTTTSATGGTDRKERKAPRWNGNIWRVSQRPWIAWPVFALLCLGLVMIGRLLPFEVLPTVDDGFVDLRIVHPAGIPPSQLDELTRRVEGSLKAIDGTAALFTTVGGYFREGLPAYRPGTSNFMVRVETRSGQRPSSEWAAEARQAITELGIHGISTRIELPRIRGVRTRLSEADIEVVLTRSDGDLLALADAEIVVAEALRDIPGLSDVERMRSGVSPRFRVEPDHRALAHYGVSHEDLQQVVSYTMNGSVLRQRMEGGDPLTLRVRYDRRAAGGPHDLERAAVPAGGNSWIHLAEVARFNLIEEPTHIERRENQRVVRIGGQLVPAGPGPGAVAVEVETVLAELALPEGVNWWLEGEIEALQETRRSFGLALGLALLVVFVVLLIQYGAVAWALAGWLTIPLCGFGSLALLWIFRQPLDAMVLAGLLISVGIVANSAILVLSETKEKLLADEKMAVADALAYASRSRLRPISLTVASTVLGMSPLLLGGSEVFGLLQPLAISLTGAILISIPIACILLPAILKSMARWERWTTRQSY